MYFLSGERVEEYLCVGCNTKQTIQKSFAFHKSPRIMICQLKRFRHDQSKINDPVSVDNHLLLDDSKKSQYNLMGAVLHISASHSTGHYETVVKCPNGSWVKLSDERLCRMDHLPLHLLRISAYVLFYAKTDRQKLEVVVASHGEPSDFVGTSLNPRSVFEDLGCAPLPVDDALLTSMGKVEPSVSPIKIVKKRKPLPKTSSSQSSHDYCIQSQNIGVSGQDGLLRKNTVSPLKIVRHRRKVPRTSSSQSSHDYCIQSQTIGVNGQGGTPSKKIPTPLKNFSSLSFDDDLIQSESEWLEKQDCSLSKGTSITTPEEVWNEAGFQDKVANSLGSPSPKRKRGTMASTVSPLSAEDNWNEPNSFCHEKSIDDLFASPSPQKDRNQMQQTEVLEENEIDDPGSPSMLGFQAVKLLDTEVDGGVSPYKTVAQNTVHSLKKCRGYPCYGKKDELIERVGLVMAKGDYHILDPKVDKGIWYNQKVADLQKNNVSSQPFTQEDLQPPSEQWHTFPSIPIPPLFNFGYIIYYLIETCTTLPDEDASEEDCEHDRPEVVPDPFDDEHETINEVKMLR
ncbi:Ubiquitin carboxyl-terminal hydrolase 17-like protein E [Frankliniella fusca]|uniref:Ubiquitin carboxyl-terminal hydrolase 17-like protein E n=1 Tax=Frankliniella fusca TaxID=407009 RepID=A0AAE1HN36_9NEOP|nr:Ubiquitin carboxyl-terminal hydrolase 17-like protein E [Frankliniella fusca]